MFCEQLFDDDIIRMNQNDNLYLVVKPAVFLLIVRSVTADNCLCKRCTDIENASFIEDSFTIHEASIPIDSANLILRLQ